MSQDFFWTNVTARDFRKHETRKYSVWVYSEDDVLPKVYAEEEPNTVEIWFKFYNFNHFYWRMLEKECLLERGSSVYYDSTLIKLFMLKKMICATNIEGVLIEYGKDGELTERSYNSVMSIHPRILRVLMDKIELLPKPMSKSEERELERQCSVFFGKGGKVQNAHDYITTYNNLVVFWEKFGMNYFDILNLPQDVFDALKKVMVLENSYRNKIDETDKPQPPLHPRHGGGSISF